MPFQAYPGGLWAPPHHTFLGVGLTTELTPGHSLTAAGHRSAMVFQVPKDGTIDTIEFLPFESLAINTSSVIRISLQNVSGAGEPDGTQDQYRDMLGSSLGALVWKAPGLLTSNGADGGTKRTVTRGDLLAVVFEYQTFTAADVFGAAPAVGASATDVILGAVPNSRPYFASYNGATWARGPTTQPSGLILALKYSDGSYNYIAGNTYAATGQTDVYLASDTTPDEAGLKFRVSADTILIGAWLRLGSFAGDKASFDLILYDSASAVLSTVVVPKGLYGTGRQQFLTPLGEDITIQRNTDYRLAVKATSPGPGKVRLITLNVVSAAHLDTHEGGSSWIYTSRTDGGVWSDDTLRRPIMGLQFGSFSDGAGGGGGGGGFVAVSRGFKRGMA